ncbi:MAG: hypothetical protein ABJG68_01435 [Crocinitomicaceae bacterium]
MKRVLLLCVAAISTLSFAQNVTENKLSFSYTQLPMVPIAKEYTNYNIVVERNYEQANEDSLMSYQVRLEAATIAYDTEMLAWKEQRKVIYRDYYTKMAAWQKAVNAGTPTQRPVDPILPAQPVMAEVKSPVLNSDIEDATVSSKINIQGYDQGEGGATVTVGINPLSNVNVVMKKSGSAATTKYAYSVNYKLPVNVKVESPSQGVIWQTILLNTVQSYTINTYASEYEYQMWWLDNEETFWPQFEKNVRTKALAEVNKQLNSQHGFPVKSRAIEIYTVKKFKDHQYNDLTNAYTAASQGYMQVAGSLDHSTAASKLNEAITIWKQMLTESNVGDKKSRINDKVTALLYCNLAEAYCWLNDYNAARTYVNLAKNSGVGKFKRAAGGIESIININEKRYKANV